MQKTHKYFLSLFLLAPVFSNAQKDSTDFQQLETVVVTGQYRPQSLKNSVYQIRVIGKEEIELTGAANIQQILKRQLGFRVSNDNAIGIADVKLNGMGGNKVKILLDGVPLADRYDERVSLSQIDINNIDHMEIVEGPMSVAYGSDAMAGVINIITKKKTKNNLSVNASAREETVGNEYFPFSYRGVHKQNLQLNYKKKQFLLSAGGSHYDFDGSKGDKYGRRKTWKPKEQWFGNAKIGYANDGFSIYYRLDALREQILVRNPVNMNNYKAIDQKFLTNRQLHQIQSEYRVHSKMHFSSFLSHTNYERRTETTRRNFEENTIEPNLPGEEDVSRLKNLSFKTTMQYELSPAVSLQPGIDLNHESASGDRIAGSPKINDFSLFASAEIKPVAGIKLRPGFRISTNSQYKAPAITPAINTKFKLHQRLDLRLAYGYGFRAPTLRELYLNFFDANHSLKGNTNLKAEHAHSFNGSLTYSPAIEKEVQLKSTLSAYYNQYGNQIQLVQSVTNNAEYTYYNIDESTTAGGSLENTFLYKHLQISAGVSYTGFASSEFADKNYLRQDDRNYLWTPELSSGITYHFTKLNTSAGLHYKFIGKKPAFAFGTVNNEEAIVLTQTAAYHLADFSLTTDIHKFIQLQAGIKNIFDVTNVTNSAASHGSNTAAGPLSVAYGRSYFLGFSFQWSRK